MLSNDNTKAYRYNFAYRFNFASDSENLLEIESSFLWLFQLFLLYKEG